MRQSLNQSNEIYKKRINTVIDFINANLDRSISLEELASVSFFSPYHFHRIFSAVTGESVFEFTNRLRLEKVAKLLKLSKDSIAEIAYRCGFSSPSTLSRSFKHYFGVSPSTYRKFKKIENSKICKELFQLDKYHCKVNEAEFKSDFPVEVKQFPQRRVAFIRVLNSFEEGVVLSVFEDVIKWAKSVNLFQSETIFGMSKDDPNITPKDKYTYEVCITIPNDFKMESDYKLETKILPKCSYAVTTVSGDFNKVATAINYLFNNWLINSMYEPEHLPGLEIFRNNENILNWNYFDLDICIPVRRIKK